MSDTPDAAKPEENLPALDGEGGGAAPKDKKKKLILILVPLILLIGGGAGLYFSGMLDELLGKKPAAEEEVKDGEKSDDKKSEGKSEEKSGEKSGGDHAAKAGEGEKKAEGGEEAKAEGGGGEHGGGEGGKSGPAFLKVPDLIVNLTSEGAPRYLRLSVQLELKSEADMKAVEAVLPRVIDQFQTYLRELRIQDLKGSKGMYRLQIELLSRVNAAAAPTEVKDVLFQEILIQ